MASSAYYKDLYKEYKKSISGLQKNIDYLTKIRNRISGDYDDEQRNVNKELDELKEDLKKATRHDSLWNNNASKNESYKEKSSSGDVRLRTSIDNIDSEIQSLRTQLSTAESNRDTAYENYKTEKKAEKEAEKEAEKSK